MMGVKRTVKKECCIDVMNLPDEMQEVVDKKGGLAGLKKLIPNRESLATESIMFHVLSDPIRLQIMHALRISDLCPCILIELTGLSNSKLSYHLSILEGAKLITSSQKKKWRIYMLTDAGREWLEP